MLDEISYSDVYDLGNKLGYLPYMIQRFVELIGEKETIKLLKFNEKKLKTVIRLNNLKTQFSEIDFLLLQKKIIFKKIRDIPEAREIVFSPISIGATIEYLNGYYMVQGKNSMFPPLILDPKPHEMIGDFAAAPGGKTTHIAQLMKNKGKIISIERSKRRCTSLYSNIVRMGVQNTIVLNTDARAIVKSKIKFDKILLDAPCSGSGVIINDPSRKTSKKEEDLAIYSKLQTELLDAAIQTLKEGGTIVYCTCSLEPEENELVIDRVLKDNDLKLVDIPFSFERGVTKFANYSFSPELKKAVRLYPHKTNGEGFFIAKMVKESGKN
ncbi:MAG: RsmB/NOP family class I SAM-dependent RNA methyltransferase [Candidatus Heimdallarchaeum endolithica]|uniref:RsmB/NOP family class I SAM-dependent RNA methyltransferase n=1 Tax=Candidatus Heimdallarchaeum endolithica TaxID=2876572 RepID=A0A9Y1BPY6_9ARCH|nr:MAG: RsmB/NOP family class I SAM-dependent RNA methyltransferase [Candidatus Heimdallarchaeum endolithica]